MNSTVTAATSILGDLIDKCPPAEACRDAFERMSKATLKMCVSTTGFGSRAANHHAQFHPRVHEDQTRSSILERDPRAQHDFTGCSRQPGFGMNIQAPYPGNCQDGRSFVGGTDEWSDAIQSSFQSSPSLQPPQYQGRSDTPAQHREYYSDPPQTLYPAGRFTTTNVPDDLYDFSSTEFGFLAMNNEDMAIYQGNSGLHLGYDAEHDWSEGVQTELFGDFFFGGAGNATDAGE